MDTVLDLIVDNNTQAGTVIFAVISLSFNLCILKVLFLFSYKQYYEGHYRLYSSVQNTPLKAHSLCEMLLVKYTVLLESTAITPIYITVTLAC